MARYATRSLESWTPASDRIVMARFYSRYIKTTIVQVYAPTNEAEDRTRILSMISCRKQWTRFLDMTCCWRTQQILVKPLTTFTVHLLIRLYELFNEKKDLDLVLIYYKTVRAKKSTQGKNKIQKNKVNSLLNTVNKMNSRRGKLRKSRRQNELCKLMVPAM